MTEGKTAIFLPSQAPPHCQGENLRPQGPRNRERGACHTVTHLNFKTSAFSFKFCHFVVTVFLTQFHTMTQCCIVNAIQRIHRSSHELGMLMLSRFSQRAFTTMANKRKTFYSKVEGINQLEKGNLKQRGTQHSAGRDRGEGGDWMTRGGDWGVEKNFYVRFVKLI